jgi:hypothetical protein
MRNAYLEEISPAPMSETHTAEIRDLITMMTSADTIERSISLSLKRREHVSEELCDRVISVASTASLTGFLRCDEPWRFDQCDADSAKGAHLTSQLHALRSKLISRRLDVRDFVTNKRTRSAAKESFALLMLSMNAGGMHNPTFANVVGLDLSGDAQGDAQLICENHFSDDCAYAFTATAPRRLSVNA